jgi:serine/threonine protein kinase/tetratricopeptide (TPR) repeat protein
MPKTPLANSFEPAQPPDPPAKRDARATRIAAGGVVPPPPPGQRAPSGPAPTVASQVSGTQPDLSRDRNHRVGTRMQGADLLQEPGSDSPKVRLTAGKVVPGTRYRILRWLGEGGMGVVYEAEHIDIERKVALKILRFDLSKQPKMAQVFRDEARAASRLGSAHIVEIYDFGELPDGRLFFAMQLLDGFDLVPLDAKTAMEPGRLIGILRQVCKGLHVAHRAGVVHRDVKPENLIATVENGRADRIKIVDFGISSMLAVGTNAEGSIAGTPHYMAPEQIAGNPFDGRLDVYALGCTAYELLTGSPPFDGDSIEDLLQKQLYEPPVPPSRVRTDLTIPPALEKVVLRALAKEPAQRYVDMADFEAALCEAQIVDKLSTPWDDLPLPDLADFERRERLLRDMPSPLAIGIPSKRRWLWPLIAGTSTLAAALFGLFLVFAPPADVPTSTVVETLTNEARGAAARLHWVVPSQSDPSAPTAYAKVRELETVEGHEASAADDRGGELRKEFATTLSEQGDTLAQQGAKGAAKQHYLWALAFDPSHAHAKEQAGLPEVLIGDFIARADRGDFSIVEQVMAEWSAAEAEVDPGLRDEKRNAAAATVAELAPAEAELVVMAVPEMSDSVKKKRVPPKADPPDEDEIIALADPATPVGAASPTAVGTTVPPAPPLAEIKKRKKLDQNPRALLGDAERDPDRAKQLAESGQSALRAGKRSEASSLFNQALAHDHTNAMALMGLSDVYFDTGADQKAVVFAEKAVSASPANQGYRLKLGDAYFKVLRYQDALKQYEQAKKLGSTKADERISRVKTKLGG